MIKEIRRYLAKILLVWLIIVGAVVTTDGRSTKFVLASSKIEKNAAYEQKEAKGIEECELIDQDNNAVGKASTSLDATSNSYSTYYDDYGYNTLSSNGKKVYTAVKNLAYTFHASTTNANPISYSDGSVGYVTTAVDVSNYDVYISDVKKIMFAFEADNPMIYWYEGITYTYNSYIYKEGNYADKKIKSIYITVSSDYRLATKRNEVNQSIVTGLQPYLSKIDELKRHNATDMAIELAIHDMIVQSVDYAYDKSGNPQSEDWAHSIEGVFTQKGVVCEGYAKAFHMLLHYAGIDSVFAAGWGSGEAHAWNLVKIGGMWYNVDITWNDRGSSYPEYYAGAMYDYFNCLNNVFLEEHSYDYTYFSEMYALPQITSDAKYSYYTYYNLDVVSSDLTSKERFVEKIVAAITSSYERNDYILRLCVDSSDITKFKSVYSSYMSEVYTRMNSNGSYTEMSAAKYSQMDNGAVICYVPLSIITVTGVTDDSTYFGSIPFAVTSYFGKSVVDLTSESTLSFSGNQLNVMYGNKNLGVYNNVSSVEPNIILEANSYSYSGGEIRPNVNVSVNGTVLIEGVDYTIAYQNNINAGAASVVLIGTGSYKGSKEIGFTIIPKDLSQTSINKVADKTYTGSKIIPELTIYNGGNKLVKNADYTVTGKNNKTVGTASLTIQGTGNYTGKITTTFKIKKKEIKTCSFSKISDKTYTGKELKPSFTVKAGNTKLKSGTDFKVTYSNNKRIGKAKIVVQGIGKNITGKKTLYFNIVPAKVTKVKATTASGKTTITWKSLSYAAGYEVFYSTSSNGSYKKLATVRKNTLKTTKFKKAKKYYVKVRAYKLVNGKKKYGNYSKKKCFKAK